MIFKQMKYQCLRDEGVDCSSHHMRAFVWDFEGSQRAPKVPNIIPGKIGALVEKGKAPWHKSIVRINFNDYFMGRGEKR
jgi:hypothetical protein